MFIRRFAVCAVLSALFPFAAHAQRVHGVVVDATSHPVPGVVVLLLDSASRVTARALSNERGEFRVSAANPGSYRIRTLRIGFRPVVSDPVALPAGGDVTKQLVLSGLPIALDTMRVVDRSVCRSFTDSGAATYAVWEQIRTALTAAELTAASRTIAATTVGYERALSPGSGRDSHVLRQDVSVTTAYVTQAWRSLSPDSLHRFGYVVTDRDNSILYYAPGLATLLSSQFVDDHCFRLVSDRKQKTVLGVAFEPTSERKRGVPEIRGTLWVDRASSELRRLELRYVNLSREQEDQAAADVDFVRMRDGTWAIARWNIRMPLVVQEVRAGHAAELKVAELRDAGGELVLARRINDTLWSSPPRELTGTVIDSLTGAPISRARVAVSGTGLEVSSDNRGRFTIPGMLPGQYTFTVHTASLDSMNTVHELPLSLADVTAPLEIRVPSAKQLAAAVCGGAAAHAAGTGIVVGNIRLRGDTSRAATFHNAHVSAEWSSDSTDATRVRRLDAPAGSDGAFRLCGLPVGTTVTLTARADGAETADPSGIRVSPTARLTHTELTLDTDDQLARRGATFIGVVVTDSSHEPIVGAEIALPDAGKSAVTDSHGVFKISGIASGEHQILVRRIGYGAADTKLMFNGHETVERRVVLGRAVRLETVTVSEKATERAMASFEENRRLGLGHFMTRTELEKYTGMNLATVVQQIPQVDMRHGRGEQAWVSSRHVTPPICSHDAACYANHGFYVPDVAEAKQGMPVACYALVWLDGVLMNGAIEPTEPFDISMIAPEQVEAVEFYAGPAQTPLKYSRMGSNCGVLVIWTRRR
jgi:hypothetical protein